MKRYIYLLFAALWSSITLAQRSNDINQAIQCWVSADSSDSIRVSWLSKPGVTSYQVHSRLDLNAPYDLIATTSDTSILIAPLDETTSAEIRITTAGGQLATGYIAVGLEHFPPHTDRRLLLVVEGSISDSIADIISRYRQVLHDERWHSTLLILPEEASVPSVKEAIIDIHAQSRLDQVLLVGHVPVPYSGNNAIDGHTSGNNHRGAWPADVFYGELDGTWTDSSVDNVEASRSANDNVPGDGKYDQTFIPGLVELAVGRVDFSNLPAFSSTEIELTRAYFQKNIDYRLGNNQPKRRGLVDNNFNLGEGFAQGAIKSFSGFFPIDSIDYIDYSNLYDTEYLWSYGAGGGNYRGASGITNTGGLAADSLQTVFTCLFGSYFGDWDNEDNFLRAALASGTTLINAWSGRPVWHFHTMAMGATVGDVVTLVENNNGSYASQFGNRQTHIALMGDPTLQMYYYPHVQNLEINVNGQRVELSWTDDQQVQYMVYEESSSGMITRLTPSPISNTFFTATCRDSTAMSWIVSPVRLEESPSGSYYNHGAGQSVSATIEVLPLVAIIDFQRNDLEISFSSSAEGSQSSIWDFGDGITSLEQAPDHTYAEPGTYTVQLIVSDGCRSDTSSIDLVLGTSSVADQDAVKEIRIFPNPVSHTLHVDNLGDHTQLRVVNTQGQVMMKLPSGSNKINVSTLPAGIYLLEFAQENHHFNRRFAVSH